MENKRLINNLTNMVLKATLYIQAGNDLKNIYGTLNINLHPGESREIEYGDLRNSYLLGLKIDPLPIDSGDVYFSVVHQRGDDIDIWLNDSFSIDITIKQLKQMNVHSPFEGISQYTETAAFRQ